MNLNLFEIILIFIGLYVFFLKTLDWEEEYEELLEKPYDFPEENYDEMEDLTFKSFVEYILYRK